MKSIIRSASLLALLCLPACAALHSKPPTALETKLYDIKTNYVTVTLTNTVDAPQTNIVQLTNLTTGVVLTTNVVTVQHEVTVITTNQVDGYDFKVKPSIAADTQVVGAVANTAAPGYGTLIAGALAGILGLWGSIRSKQASTAQDVSTNLAQVVETGRNIIQSLPNGAAIGAKYDAWMQDHQQAEGVAQAVAKVVDTAVNDNPVHNSTVTAQGILAQVVAPLAPPSTPTPAGLAASQAKV